MSFNFEFVAVDGDAKDIIRDEITAPDCVKTFILSAMSGFPKGVLVHIKAYGHLDAGQFGSNTTIEVKRLEIRNKKEV